MSSSKRYSAVKELKFTLTKLRYRTDIIISIAFIVVFVFLILGPLFQIIYTSLTYQSNDLRMVRDARVGQFTLYHYLRVFTGRLSRSLFFKPFINSLLVGGGVTLLAMVVGTVLAWVLIFKNDRIAGEKGMITSLFGITPPDWFSYGFFPIIICSGLHYYAYSFLLVSGALRTVDSQNLKEAGAIAGLKKGAVLRKITFPIVLPALSSSFVLATTTILKRSA